MIGYGIVEWRTLKCWAVELDAVLCGHVNLVGIHLGLVASLAVECGVSGFDIVRQGALRFGGSVGMLGVVAVLWNVMA